jgi:AraC family transcriptional regulator
MTLPSRTRAVIRRIAGRPMASGRVPAKWPLLLDRYQALFESVSLPPLPAPVLLVHTGGKPLAYVAAGRREQRQSIPGFVTFVPRQVRAEIELRGVGEGTLIYFADEQSLPAWLRRAPAREPFTFTNEVIVSVTRKLMRVLEAGGEESSYLRALGNALLAEVQHELGKPLESQQMPASRSGLRVAHAATRHIERHLGEPLAVADLAAACGLGTTSFAKSFRGATGVTPHRYLRRARIERACALLRTTALPVGDVALTVGFRGQSHFCAAFSQERGMTPSAYRRSCLEKRRR